SHLAPNRFVQNPIKIRNKEPSITGTAVTRETCPGVKAISVLMCGINEEMMTQTINPTMRLLVCRGSCSFSVFIFCLRSFLFGTLFRAFMLIGHFMSLLPHFFHYEARLFEKAFPHKIKS